MDYAERTGLTIIGNYIDRALSARTDNRPEFRRMIKDSAKGCFEVVHVWKLDRFSRDRYDSAHYKHILKKNGVKVVSAKENISEGPEGIIFESTRDRLAELEKQKSELEVAILEEQIERPILTEEQIRFGIERFRKLNIEMEEDKKRLIDNFINAIYLYDDKITFTFNYKDGTKTVALAECENSSVGSDIYCFGPNCQMDKIFFKFVL